MTIVSFRDRVEAAGEGAQNDDVEASGDGTGVTLVNEDGTVSLILDGLGFGAAACKIKVDDCLGDKIDGERLVLLAGDKCGCKTGALYVISSTSSSLSDNRFRSNKDDGKEGAGELLSEWAVAGI